MAVQTTIVKSSRVAVRRHHDVTITITAREIDPASLIIEQIADPNARLLGRKPHEP